MKNASQRLSIAQGQQSSRKHRRTPTNVRLKASSGVNEAQPAMHFIEKVIRFAQKPPPEKRAAIKATFNINRHDDFIRNIKDIFGIDSYIDTDDRRLLEKTIFPYFLHQRRYQDILFVGCDWYTRGYNKSFENKANFLTMEPDPIRQRYGAQKHIQDTLQNLTHHFRPNNLDLIFCNGVFGWGLNEKVDVEQAFRACYDCLRNGGVLVLGWNDVEEHRPFCLQECHSLRLFSPFVFPPLGMSKYLTDTTNRHTYNFYVKA